MSRKIYPRMGAAGDFLVRPAIHAARAALGAVRVLPLQLRQRRTHEQASALIHLPPDGSLLPRVPHAKKARRRAGLALSAIRTIRSLYWWDLVDVEADRLRRLAARGAKKDSNGRGSTPLKLGTGPLTDPKPVVLLASHEHAPTLTASRGLAASVLRHTRVPPGRCGSSGRVTRTG